MPVKVAATGLHHQSCAETGWLTHGGIPAEQWAAIGITNSLVRLSAGIKDADDSSPT